MTVFRYRHHQIQPRPIKATDGLSWIPRALIFEDEQNLVAVKAIEERNQKRLLLTEQEALDEALELAKRWIDNKVSPSPPQPARHPGDRAGEQKRSISDRDDPLDETFSREMESLAANVFLPKS